MKTITIEFVHKECVLLWALTLKRLNELEELEELATFMHPDKSMIDTEFSRELEMTRDLAQVFQSCCEQTYEAE